MNRDPEDKILDDGIGDEMPDDGIGDEMPDDGWY